MLAMLAMPERKFGKCFRMTVVLLHLSIPKYLGLIFLVDESFCRVRYIILSSSISSAVGSLRFKQYCVDESAADPHKQRLKALADKLYPSITVVSKPCMLIVTQLTRSRWHWQ